MGVITVDWPHEESPIGSPVVKIGHGGEWRVHDGSEVADESGVFHGVLRAVNDGVAMIEPKESHGGDQSLLRPGGHHPSSE